MIETVADLLARIVEKNVPVLDAEKVDHGPTVGAMYEGLTTQLLSTAASFKGLTLDVVSGFAEGDDGTRSPQLDCMVVVAGSGRKIPHTTAWIYPLESVIAAVEVKKNLRAADISDGYAKFRALAKLRPRQPPIRRHVVERNFQTLTRKVVPADWRQLPNPWQMLYSVLLLETVLPARILLGYHGHRTVTGFRRAVAKDIADRVGEANTGPLALPTAVISDRFAVIKTDGLPFTMPVLDDTGKWRTLVSTTEPPMRVLLETIWSRITARFGAIEGLFGEDLHLHASHALLDYMLDPSGLGWQVWAYDDVPIRTKPGATATTQTWQPHELTMDEAIVAMWMCKQNGPVAILNSQLPLPSAQLAAAVASLCAKGIIGPLGDDPSRYDLLTEALAVVVAPDGKTYAGENVAGQLSRWVNAQVSERPDRRGGPRRPE